MHKRQTSNHPRNTASFCVGASCFVFFFHLFFRTMPPAAHLGQQAASKCSTASPMWRNQHLESVLSLSSPSRLRGSAAFCSTSPPSAWWRVLSVFAFRPNGKHTCINKCLSMIQKVSEKCLTLAQAGKRQPILYIKVCNEYYILNIK